MLNKAIVESPVAFRFPTELAEWQRRYLLKLQADDGSIKWYESGHLDPWDHIEAAMGLSIVGEQDAALKAFQWLAETQLDNGSWWACYFDPKRAQSHVELHHVAYIATGLWHHYLVFGEIAALERFLPVVQRAIDYVIQHQMDDGLLPWAVNRYGVPEQGALLTANSSILKSLEAANNIAVTLGKNADKYHAAHAKLLKALNSDDASNNTMLATSRFSMDWFYPILGGAYTGDKARAHIQRHWQRFVRPNMGCLCVDDQPWVTVAESCELVMALLASDMRAKAETVFKDIQQWIDHSDGVFWTGYQYQINEIWPLEKTTWTSGAILLAADALSGHTNASELFLKSEILKP